VSQVTFQGESDFLEEVGSWCHLLVNYCGPAHSWQWKMFSTVGCGGKEGWDACWKSRYLVLLHR